jgi:hypothetical protein
VEIGSQCSNLALGASECVSSSDQSYLPQSVFGMSRTNTLITGAVALAIVAAILMVWTNLFGIQQLLGMRPSEKELMAEMTEIAASGGQVSTFSKGLINTWKVAEGHKLERFGLNDEGAVFARLTSSVVLDGKSFDWPNLGLSWLMTQEFNNSVAGRRIEIGIVARRSQQNSSEQLFLMYATQQAGNTGWKPVPLSNQFELQKIYFDVPSPEGGFQNPPIMILHSDPDGKGRSVEMLGAYVRVAPAN